MHPSRAASLLAVLGIALIAAALALRVAAMLEAAARVEIPEVRAAALPIVGDYTLSADGSEIFFQQGQPANPEAALAWYSMPVDGGLIAPASTPHEELGPFQVSGGRVLLNGKPFSGSLDSESVLDTALAPGGSALAFSTLAGDDRSRLYILYDAGRLEWMGEEERYFDLDWNPQGTALAFIAPRDGFDQVFTLQEGGQTYRQLTFDPTRKLSPRWSPDGSSIAYLAASSREKAGSLGRQTPTPPALIWQVTPDPYQGPGTIRVQQVEVYLMDADGGNARALTHTPAEEYGLAWIRSRLGSELAYAVRVEGHPSSAFLYAANPSTGLSRRVYPPVSLDAMQCPAQIPAGSSGAARITVTNSGLVPLDLPLVLRAQAEPFAGNEPSDRNAVHLETVTLLPGETRVLNWQSPPAPGRVTYLSVITRLENPFPISQLSCSAPNTYLGLPGLPFLSISIPFMAAGMALCIPRLLQRRRGWLWALWLSAPVVLAEIITIETRLGK